MSKPPLLFLCPVPPDGLNSGLRIRAQHSLQALRQNHEVHSLHLNTGWRWDRSALPRFPPADPGLIWRRAHYSLRPTAFVSESRFFSRLAQWEVLARWRRYGYTRVHLFRAAMLPFVGPLMQAARLRVELDMDELESSTRLGLARLAQLRGDTLRAQMYEREAAYFAEMEKLWLPRMDRIFVSSWPEKDRLESRIHGLKVEVLANLPRWILQHPTPLNSDSRDLLFVGNLDYYPNRDAVQWLCSEVVPRLRRRASNWRLVVAGPGKFRPLGMDEVVDLGPVPDLQPHYRNALAALVPIRAGGGTRIKALEAFAYARTVVATPFGMEGLPIQHGQQGFVAESADQFADQCALLLSRPALCLQAGLLAYQWLRDHASLVNFREQLA